MLHRAMLGSIERFMGILVEHYAGHLPLWLAPRHAVVCTITSDADAYAGEVVSALEARGLHAKADARNEKISYKVREHSLAKVPVILAVGKREVERREVSVRRLGSRDQRVVGLGRGGRDAGPRGGDARRGGRRGGSRVATPMPSTAR